ncbi:taste receptor type 2 member 40-like [Latimeria chalumnae]|uniref:taste receptor type 2 member 40-like n=1 Tax=Latimeria chalumnae TaxID=7897 RepID=UPI0003C12CAB|nr:PREDICTED: taste receptor type 2 member 40-like [Latimeria chalumnae]|eukprot:XP_006012751.1 PREDICTED: taste receptor type 2 member 40-like [Latimeria chalumnae]
MPSTSVIVELVVRLTIICVGLVGNTFILHAYFVEYRNRKVLQPNELITTLLALFNLLATANLVLPNLRTLLFCSYFGEAIYKFTDSFSNFVSKSTYWFTAWLCFYYCVKIVKVNGRFFLRLKQRISLVVNILLLSTITLCFTISIPILYLIKLKLNSSVPCKTHFILGRTLFIYGIVNGVLTSYLPLVVMVICSLGIVIFLCQHSRNMDKSIAAGGTSHSEAHKTVAIMLICLILLYMTCAITVLLASIQLTLGEINIMTAIPYTASIFSTGSSVILIIGTVKLRQSFKKLWCFCG